MNLKKIFGLGVIIGGINLFANSVISYAIEYERGLVQSFGGSSFDYFDSIGKTSDGGFVVVGESSSKNIGFESKGNRDGVIIKYNRNGEQEWIQSFGGSSSDYFNYGVELSDGGFVVVGETESTDAGINNKGDSDGIIVKYSQNGERKWIRSFGGSDFDYFRSVAETANGGFVVVGESNSTNAGFEEKGIYDGIIVKYSRDGEQEWIQQFGGGLADSLKDVVETTDGGFVVVGESNSTDAGFEGKGGYDGIIIKYNRNGEQEWIQSFGGSSFDYFNSVVETSDGGFVVVGYSGSANSGFENKGDSDGMIVKYNQNGEQEWIQSFGGSGTDQFNSIVETFDKGFMVVGESNSIDAGFENKGNSDGIIVKYNRNGEQEWIQSFGGSGTDRFKSGIEKLDGLVVVVGESNSTNVDFENKGFYDGIIVNYYRKQESDVQINGRVETMVADVTIPSVSPDLVINPNLPEGSVSPEFNISNDSVSPIRLELKVFEQTTNTFNDVLPTKYDSWEGLNTTESKNFALGLIAKEGEGWQTLMTPTSYVANHQDHEIGIIKPTSSVDFSFDVKHGTSFSEAKTVQYKMVFVFDLLN